MDDQSLTVMGAEMSLSRSPEVVLKEAEMVAGPWGRKVEALKLYKVIGSSKHLYIEAWQMLGAMYRVTARTRDTRYVEFGEIHGYEATAEAFHMPSGQVVSVADGMCLSDEDNWGLRSKYEYIRGEDGRDRKTKVGDVVTPLQQLRSMAQTRAQSKVLANLFKWVAKLKGYATTPAEEMTGAEGAAPEEQAPPQRRAAPSNGGSAGAGFISSKQASRLWAISFSAGKSKEQANAVLRKFGFADAKDVTLDKYEAVCSEMESPS